MSKSCTNCGEQINDTVESCESCGAVQNTNTVDNKVEDGNSFENKNIPNKSNKKTLTAVIIVIVALLFSGAVVVFFVAKSVNIKIKVDDDAVVNNVGNVVEISDNMPEQAVVDDRLDESLGANVNEPEKNAFGREEVESINECDYEYKAVLDKYKQDFSDCTGTVKSAQCDGRDPNKPTNFVIILDASGSMNAMMDSKSMMQVAKDALNRFVENINEEDVQVSLIVYGHKGGNTQAQKQLSCDGIDEIYYLGALDKEILKSKINSFSATGWTPIAQSLKKAEQILTPYSNDSHNNVVLLVSDGEETCGGDPVGVASALRASNIKVFTDVIGFGVSGAAEDQLKNIANAGGGKYLSANSENELNDIFSEYGGSACFFAKFNAYLNSANSVHATATDCGNRLMSEYNAMNQAIGLSPLYEGEVSEKCQKYADTEYTKRYDEMKSSVDEQYNDGAKALDEVDPWK